MGWWIQRDVALVLIGSPVALNVWVSWGRNKQVLLVDVFCVLMSFLCGILYPVFKNKWWGTRLGPVPVFQGVHLALVMWILSEVEKGFEVWNSHSVGVSFIFTSGHHRRCTGWWYDLNLEQAGILRCWVITLEIKGGHGLTGKGPGSVGVKITWLIGHGKLSQS